MPTHGDPAHPRRRAPSLYAEVSKGDVSVPVVITSGATLANVREHGGYAPKRLDPVIEMLIQNAESGAELLQRYTPMFETLMDELQSRIEKFVADGEVVRLGADGAPLPNADDDHLATIVKYADKVSIMIERLNKMTMNAVRAKDDATRLRSFLAGDQDRGELDNLSETQLRKIVAEAASGFAAPESIEEVP